MPYTTTVPTELLKLIPSSGSVRLCDGPIQVGGSTLRVRFELGRTKTAQILGDLYAYRPERPNERITLAQALRPESDEKFGNIVTEVVAIPRGSDVDVGYLMADCSATRCSYVTYVVATVADGKKKELLNFYQRGLVVYIDGPLLTAEWEESALQDRHTQLYERGPAGYRLVSDLVWCIPFTPPGPSIDRMRGAIGPLAEREAACAPTLHTSTAYLQPRLRYQLTPTSIKQDLTVFYAAAPFALIRELVRYELVAPAYSGEWLWLVAVLPTQDERVFDLAYAVGHCDAVRCSGYTLAVLDLDSAKPVELLRVDAPSPIAIEANADRLTVRWVEPTPLSAPAQLRTRVYDRVAPHGFRLRSDTTAAPTPFPTPLPSLGRP